MRTLYPYLTLAGSLPFVFCAVCLWFGIDSMPMSLHQQATVMNTTTVMTVYGLVIASFMAGSHWGMHVQLESNQHQWASRLPLISNVIAVGLWVGFLIQPISDFVILLLMSFSIMLVVDVSLHRVNIISKPYLKVRCLVTAIVNISLIVAIISL